MASLEEDVLADELPDFLAAKFFDSLNSGLFDMANAYLDRLMVSCPDGNRGYTYSNSSGIDISGNLLFAVAYSGYELISNPEQDARYERCISYQQYYRLVAKLVLSYGCDVGAIDSFFGETSLMMAIAYDNIDAAYAILEFCPIDVINFVSTKHPLYTSSALILSIQRINDEMTQKLVSNGANVTLASVHFDIINPISISDATKTIYTQSTIRKVERAKGVSVTPMQWAFIFASSPEIIKLLYINNDRYKYLLTSLFEAPLPDDSPYWYLKIEERDLSGLLYRGTYFPERLNSLELYPVIAHYWNDITKFLRYRQDRLLNITSSFIFTNIASRLWSTPKERIVTINLKFSLLCQVRCCAEAIIEGEDTATKALKALIKNEFVLDKFFCIIDGVAEDINGDNVEIPDPIKATLLKIKSYAYKKSFSSIPKLQDSGRIPPTFGNSSPTFFLPIFTSSIKDMSSDEKSKLVKPIATHSKYEAR